MHCLGVTLWPMPDRLICTLSTRSLILQTKETWVIWMASIIFNKLDWLASCSCDQIWSRFSKCCCYRWHFNWWLTGVGKNGCGIQAEGRINHRRRTCSSQWRMRNHSSNHRPIQDWQGPYSLSNQLNLCLPDSCGWEEDGLSSDTEILLCSVQTKRLSLFFQSIKSWRQAYEDRPGFIWRLVERKQTSSTQSQISSMPGTWMSEACILGCTTTTTVHCGTIG